MNERFWHCKFSEFVTPRRITFFGKLQSDSVRFADRFLGKGSSVSPLPFWDTRQAKHDAGTRRSKPIPTLPDFDRTRFGHDGRRHASVLAGPIFAGHTATKYGCLQQTMDADFGSGRE